ncbi:MAG: hypothetical protein IPK42_05035 [Betaproteobacteria bacterium]|nr:hypothetical protein [Betaproteobacteria bacterium]
MTPIDVLQKAIQDTRPVHVNWLDQCGNRRTITSSAPSAIATDMVIAVLADGARGNSSDIERVSEWSHASQALAEQHLERVKAYVAQALALLEGRSWCE